MARQADRKTGRGRQTGRQTGSPAVLLITQTGPRAHKSHKFQLSAYPWKINVNFTMQSRNRPSVLCCLLLAACLPAVPQCVWLICLILRLNKQQKEKERERESWLSNSLTTQWNIMHKLFKWARYYRVYESERDIIKNLYSWLIVAMEIMRYCLQHLMKLKC